MRRLRYMLVAAVAPLFLGLTSNGSASEPELGVGVLAPTTGAFAGLGEDMIAGIKQFLEDHISFYAEGPARVVSAKLEITPKDVSWTENRSTITSTGAAAAAQFQWDTPRDSANGAHG